jgi:hypothetical protein
MWVMRWRELVELALPTAGAIRYDAEAFCRSMGIHDCFAFCDVLADIERAWVHLRGRWSLESLVIEYTMQGYELRTIEDCLRIRHGSARPAFQRACTTMAMHLGWRENDNSDEAIDIGADEA